MGQVWQGRLEKIDDFRWRIPTSYKPGMKVPGLIFASESLIPSILKDKALEQVRVCSNETDEKSRSIHTYDGKKEHHIAIPRHCNLEGGDFDLKGLKFPIGLKYS